MSEKRQPEFKRARSGWFWFLWIVFLFVPISIGPWYLRVVCGLVLGATAFALIQERHRH